VTDKTIPAFKGFDQNMQCRGFQYEVGKTYKHKGKVEACETGFHACVHPLNIFSYYPPATSRFAKVTLGGKTHTDGTDTKIAAARITIEAELKLPEIIQAAVDWVFARAKWSEGPVAIGPNEGATASGDRGAATASGDSGAATASGDSGAATASGYGGAATASGYGGAATASGVRGAATASGDRGAATASGDRGAATASGYGGRVKGAKGSALFLVERNADYDIINVWSGIVGKDGVKVDTWYTLQDGKPVAID
jgi:hypothetical protein